jgi:hypothetical protein
VDNGKLTKSKLATLDSLITALLYHDRELKRTGKVNLTLGRCGVGHVSYSSSQRLSNGNYCSHCKCDSHIEKDCWQKRPKRRLKSGDRKRSTTVRTTTIEQHHTGVRSMGSQKIQRLRSRNYYHMGSQIRTGQNPMER